MKKYLSIFFVCLLATLLSTNYCFAMENCSVKSNNSSLGTCKALSGTLSMVYPIPAKDCYFSHFESSSGSRISPPSKTYDFLSITVHGVKYEDYFLSKCNSPYELLTVAAYNKIVQEYVKLMYGTTSYRVSKTIAAYDLSKYTSAIAVFKKKLSPNLSIPKEIKVNMKTKTIKAISKSCQSYTCSFKSSNSKACTIDKTTGLVTIKSEGCSVITIVAAATAKTKEKTFESTVKIYPSKIILKKASPSGKSIRLCWSKDSHATGYKIAVSKKSDFSHKTIYTVNTPKTCSKVLKSLKEGSKYYVKVRAYKKSCGKYLYGKWSNSKSISLH